MSGHPTASAHGPVLYKFGKAQCVRQSRVLPSVALNCQSLMGQINTVDDFCGMWNMSYLKLFLMYMNLDVVCFHNRVMVHGGLKG